MLLKKGYWKYCNCYSKQKRDTERDRNRERAVMYLLYLITYRLGAVSYILIHSLKSGPLAAQMYGIPQVWAWRSLLITLFFLLSSCVNGRFTIYGTFSTVWIPGNRSEHFLSRWDLILLGDFFCFINTGRQLRQTIPNKPQRKSDVFIQLCLMTVLLLPAWLSSSDTVPKMELEIPLLTWPQICEL